MKSYSRFQDPIAFSFAIFQIKELVRMTQNKSKKHMSIILSQIFWC